MTTVLRGSSPGTGCQAPKTGALMSVVISGLVKSSKMPGVHNGSTVNIQFLAEPQGLIRDIVGQGVVYDGISPYKICPEDFDVKFSTGVKGRFIPEKKGLWEKKEPVWPPVTKDTPQGPLVTGALWMSILRGRSVYDGAFVSMDPADPRVGLPLDMHDASSKYGAFFDVTFKRWSMPFQGATHDGKGRDTLKAAEGVYDQSIVIRSTMKIWKDWPGNIAIEIDFTRMSIAESPTIEPAKEDQPDDPPTPW